MRAHPLLLLAGRLLLVAALVVAVAVIPPVRTDTYPKAAPERAAAAFTVNAFLNVTLGIALLIAARRRSASKVLLVPAALVALLLGLALLDAGGAFSVHGPPMRTVVYACFATAGIDFAGGILALVAGYRGKPPEIFGKA